MATTPFLHLGSRLWGSTICGNEFLRASGGRVTSREEYPIWIAAMEKRLQFWHRHQHWHWHIPNVMSIHYWTTGSESLLWKGTWRSTSTSFVERMSTSPWRSVSNFNTDNTTHECDREAPYRNQLRCHWLEQYFRHSTQHVLPVCIYFQTRYQSRYNRTVCYLQRSSLLPVKTFEADSTIDCWA